MVPELFGAKTPSVPILVLTGFLGSGKTTVLNRLLRMPEYQGTAVIVNEMGEIGLDHLLVERSSEGLAVLEGGCVCCTMRTDLVVTLHKLMGQRDRGELPPFARVVIETTGLAEPAPILHALMVDPRLARRTRLDGVITTVDAVNGLDTLERHAISVEQAAVADRLLLTKLDLAGDAAALRQRLAALNPRAAIVPVVNGDLPADALADLGLYDGAAAQPARWLGHEHAHDHDHGHDHGHDHLHDIDSFAIELDRPIRFEAFEDWLGGLLELRGPDLLRVKALLDIAGRPGATVIHGVQHIFHPPVELPAWPDAPRRSRLVFITRKLGRAQIEAGLKALAA